MYTYIYEIYDYIYNYREHTQYIYDYYTVICIYIYILYIL